LLHLIRVLRGAQNNHIRQGDRRDLPVASVANRKRPPREAQLAIRDAGRAKEADLPLAVRNLSDGTRAGIIDTGPKSIRMPHPGMDSGVASHRWRV
jgi:hypothetical protein